MWQLDATTIAAKVRSREVTALEVADSHIERALRWNDSVQALLHFEPEDVRRQARAIDRRIEAGQNPGRLAGVPVALKDNLSTTGMPTTCGSRILETYFPPYDADVVERLRADGAILFGKTNLDEFAMGSSTENSAFGPTRNPYAPDRTPGGSSGGSAAAVATGIVPLALGSDTGGSIRQPAAFCGIVGMKPTYGMVSRYGLGAFASSLDQIGPFARTVEDARLLLEVIAGHDQRDATSSVRTVAGDGTRTAGSLRGMRIGLPVEYFGEGIDPEVRAAVGAAQAVLQRLGAEVVEVSLPLTKYAIAVYYIVAPSEASSNLARYDGMRYGERVEGDDSEAVFAATRGDGFGTEVKRRILLGTFALSSGYYEAYYGRAQKVRAAIRHEMETVFEDVDILLTPTTPTVAFPIGEKIDDPLAMYMNDILTVTANLTGTPAISLPCGRGADDMPIGLQLMAPRFAEESLFHVASAYENEAAPPFPWPPEPNSAHGAGA
ncbi:MAG: Asp-tRNA(Asn)/Glu-tRNA(Gln) amidotransferase subunit GatA [Planctomycetota bacterium]|jgi:aspartyl-tRNA(Asn)/glutamyl-tRNA(Gln) amidotransferase subunit A